MSKFKVGDIVYLNGKLTRGSISKSYYNIPLTIKSIYRDLWFDFTSAAGNNTVFKEDYHLLSNQGGEEMKPYQRKTYRLLKDTHVVKKGAVYQEQCDDGTQPYRLLSVHDHKSGDRDNIIEDRSLVEEQPQWFVEVFAVEPQYMTREELDQWEAFKGQKKRGCKSGSKKVKKPVVKAGTKLQEFAMLEKRHKGNTKAIADDMGISTKSVATYRWNAKKQGMI